MDMYNKPLPEIDPVSSGYWQLTRQHKLSVQRCSECGDKHFPPSPVCPACLSGEQGWEIVSGRGTLLSWVGFHRAYWPGFSRDLPYHVCLVQLEEGPIVVSNFGGDVPEQAKLGLPVRVVFEDVTSEVTLPKFVPA
jgi:uncharacterized OB-fold protein